MSAQEVLRKRSTPREGELSSALAIEAQRIVQDAARPIPAGETVKGQLRRACRALGYPDGSWRVREAWYGHAGCWSAKAFDDLRSRYLAWSEKQEALAEAQARKAAALFEALANRFEGGGDAGLDRATIDRIRGLASRLGC